MVVATHEPTQMLEKIRLGVQQRSEYPILDEDLQQFTALMQEDLIDLCEQSFIPAELEALAPKRIAHGNVFCEQEHVALYSSWEPAPEYSVGLYSKCSRQGKIKESMVEVVRKFPESNAEVAMFYYHSKGIPSYGVSVKMGDKAWRTEHLLIHVYGEREGQIEALNVNNEPITLGTAMRQFLWWVDLEELASSKSLQLDTAEKLRDMILPGTLESMS
ncbi:MAG: hypothetical protein ACOYT9_02695 [Patescibacteria group bacterium]